MEKESKLREGGLAGTTQEAAFGLNCRLTVLSSSASQPFMHQLPQGGGWEHRVRREKRGVRSGPLEGLGAQTDLITVMPVLPLQNHFQIFMICQLTSVDTLLGSGINSLRLGNSQLQFRNNWGGQRHGRNCVSHWNKMANTPSSLQKRENRGRKIPLTSSVVKETFGLWLHQSMRY